MDDHDAKYKALLQRISRYPVTDPEARARMLAEVEAAYRKEVRAARSRGALTAPGTGHDGSPKLWKKFRTPAYAILRLRRPGPYPTYRLGLIIAPERVRGGLAEGFAGDAEKNGKG